jgi:hypothetical protein
MLIAIRKIVQVLFVTQKVNKFSDKYVSGYWQGLHDPMYTERRKFSGKYTTLWAQKF